MTELEIKEALKRHIAVEYGDNPDIFEMVMLDLLDAYIGPDSSAILLAEEARVTLGIAALFMDYMKVYE